MIKRHKTHAVKVGNVVVGGGNPVIVQSMTNTDTADVESSVKQVKELSDAGSEIVRLTVDTERAAAAIPKIKAALLKDGYDVPLVGCFHYNGHRLLSDYPELAKSLDKYRINPGNVGFGQKRDCQFEEMIEIAIKYDKPVRIGVNWGSLDEDLSTKLMDDNAASENPKSADEILREALILSTLTSADKAVEIGLPKDKIILSCKVSRTQDLIYVYQELAKRSDYALHVGLTEAGMGNKAIVATSGALSILLQQGIGDTIRASLTPEPGESRTTEVKTCQNILQTLGVRSFTPLVTACPGCGRTTSSFFQELAQKIQTYLDDNMPVWRDKYPDVANMDVAVMGCIVNGPGESKHANIGISLPGTGETPSAPVFVDGQKAHTLKGDKIAEQFIDIVQNYVESNYKN